MALVSVLLTCYNHVDYLPEAVQGVLDQTYANIEIIAIDDGSTDGTREWLTANADRIRERCPIHLEFNPENRGTYGTLNRGIELAKGEYLAVLNDDDLWLPGKIAAQVALLESDPRIGLTHTDGIFIDGKGVQIHGEPLGFPYPTTGTGDQLARLIEHNRMIASSALFRRACLSTARLFDEELYGEGDWRMWLGIAMDHHIGFVPESLTRYRVHGANACLRTERMHRDEIRIRNWIESKSAELLARGDADLNRAIAHNAACLGTAHAWVGEMAEARRAYRRSIALMPGRAKSWLRLALTLLPPKLFRRLG